MPRSGPTGRRSALAHETYPQQISPPRLYLGDTPYGSERLHHAIAFVRFSMQLGKVICTTDPDEAAARDERMVADWAAGMKPPAPPRPGLGPGLHTGAAGGHLARQGRVRLHGAAPLMFDDEFGGPGALIARSTAALAALPHCAQGGLRALGISTVALAGPDTPSVAVIEDVDGVYNTWLDELGADVVLVRPDFHLYAAAHRDGAGELAAGFLTRLGVVEPATIAQPGRVA